MVVAKTLAGVLESGVGRGKTVNGLFRGKISFKAPQSTSKTFIILCVCDVYIRGVCDACKPQRRSEENVVESSSGHQAAAAGA